MSFGGSVQAMIVSIKNNARNRTNVFKKGKNENETAHIHKNSLQFKTVPADELEIIKKNIREKAQKENKKRRIIAGIIIIPILVGIFFTVRYKISQYTNKVEDRRSSESSVVDDKTDRLLKDSNYWLKNGNYLNAKKLLYKAYQINPGDYHINYANANVYVLDCVENGVGCKSADRMVKGMIERYGNEDELLALKSLLEQK